jgi:hypothetical protein
VEGWGDGGCGTTRRRLKDIDNRGVCRLLAITSFMHRMYGMLLGLWSKATN